MGSAWPQLAVSYRTAFRYIGSVLCMRGESKGNGANTSACADGALLWKVTKLCVNASIRKSYDCTLSIYVLATLGYIMTCLGGDVIN
jgi:hypothetical protein